MVSKSQRKQIIQLKQKKYRSTTGLFVAEGEKVVNEFLSAGWSCEYLFTLDEHFYPKAITIGMEVMKQITHFKNPSPVLGVFKVLEKKISEKEEITIAVDCMNDPGNLGTIIRLCDWFGVNELICSSKTVDCYNSKVVQATMGSLVRVQCRYEKDFASYLKSLGKPIFGADGNGSSIYQSSLVSKATYIFGNESHGLSKEVEEILTHKISIPNYRTGRGAESLNVASAAAIFLSELFRGS